MWDFAEVNPLADYGRRLHERHWNGLRLRCEHVLSRTVDACPTAVFASISTSALH